LSMVPFDVYGNSHQGYLALPPGGQGKGVLFLHAWWGLKDFFKATCDRLAAEGFTVFAPDLMPGQIAATVEEAQTLDETRDFQQVKGIAEGALKFLQDHPALEGEPLSAVGFSMGAWYAILLDESHPEAFDKIVLFYGGSEADFSASRTRYQLHFAEQDEWEPLENVHKIEAQNAEIHLYPSLGHWFFEADREDAYDAQAAQLAWERMVQFLSEG
jgi:carboxymethylenebutenolidase